VRLRKLRPVIRHPTSLGLCALLLLTACATTSPAALASPRVSSTVSTSPQVAWPAPAQRPNYPPRDLADLAALAQKGVDRRVGFTEGQPLDECSMGWTMFQEVEGTPPPQLAADLVHMAVKKGFMFQTCGGNLFGSLNIAYCNCYRGDHGVLYIERGPSRQPAPGMMQVVFWVRDDADSPGDWRLTVPAPAAPA